MAFSGPRKHVLIAASVLSKGTRRVSLAAKYAASSSGAISLNAAHSFCGCADVRAGACAKARREPAAAGWKPTARGVPVPAAALQAKLPASAIIVPSLRAFATRLRSGWNTSTSDLTNLRLPPSAAVSAISDRQPATRDAYRQCQLSTRPRRRPTANAAAANGRQPETLWHTSVTGLGPGYEPVSGVGF